MGSLTDFVDAIYDCFGGIDSVIEEDQKLPVKEVLEEVCQVLLNVSCMREEGRFPSFRVSFLRPNSELLGGYIYAHELLFEQPIPFNTREMHKLAPALNPDMSYLMVDVSEKPFKAVGIAASYTMWERLITREVTTGNRMPMVPNILVSGPGDLKACFGETSIVTYSAGCCVFSRTDTFTSTYIADALARDSNVSEKERLRLLYRVLRLMSFYGHGGAILIVPSAESCKEFIDLKYRIPSNFLFEMEKKAGRTTEKVREKEIITYADLIAKFTSVDGSVVLTKDLDLLGFGAETIMDNMDSKHPSMCFLGYDNQEDRSKKFKDHGMRHRAGYRFCNAVDGSVVFIISQDGTIEACTKHDGRVIVYDNVALPML